MSGHLPHALLELTLARASARLEGIATNAFRRHGAFSWRRHAHQQAFLQDPTVLNNAVMDSPDDRSFYARYVREDITLPLAQQSSQT